LRALRALGADALGQLAALRVADAQARENRWDAEAGRRTAAASLSPPRTVTGVTAARRRVPSALG
jgi:hypothetical protein